MNVQSHSNEITAVAPVIWLRVVNGPQAGRYIEPTPAPRVLGRGAWCQVVLEDPEIPPTLSREHATISPRGGELMIRDHSTNGTRVGSQRLTQGEYTALHAGDEVQLGHALKLVVENARKVEREARPSDSNPVPAAQPESLRRAICCRSALASAWRGVSLNRGGPGPDGVTVDQFARYASLHLEALRLDLLRERYQPMAPRLFAAPKHSGGVRVIAILNIRDRIVQSLVRNVLSPLLEPHFSRCSFAYRPGVCAHHALRAVDSALRDGLMWIAETDVSSFFDSVVHSLLLERLGAIVPDPFVLTLVARCLAVGSCSPGVGLAQGAPSSPLLSNLYMAEFDEHMLKGGSNLVRYGDDMVLLAAERYSAAAALAEASGFLSSRLRLSLREDKTRLTHIGQGFTFLGYRFNAAGRQASPEAVTRLNERLAGAVGSENERIKRGWRAYFGTKAEPCGKAGPPVGQFAADALAHGSAADLLLSLFVGREDMHAVQSTAGAKRSHFLPASGAADEATAREHLAGSQTAAIYLLQLNGMLRSAVLDIDAIDPESLSPVEETCAQLRSVCREFGIPAILEDSGRRGRHLWLLFSDPVDAPSARRLARLLAQRAGHPRSGVRIEILPRHTEWPGPELGDAVKLPLGLHPVTGRRCWLLDADDRPIPDYESALQSVRRIPAQTVPALIEALSAAHSVGPEAAEPVKSAVSELVLGCSVLRGIVARAQSANHLRHTHNLILLYTAGRLGAAGARFVHGTIAPCHNYDPTICQGYIDRLEPARKPLTCRRIREWLEEQGEQAMCTCSGGKHTPLDGIAGPVTPVKTARRRPFAAISSNRGESLQGGSERTDSGWDLVADDLFSEDKSSDEP